MIDRIEMVSLGSGATIPDHRPPAATYVNVDGYEFLVDTPEGVQQRLFENGCGLTVDDIYITNAAKRSLLGLPGLVNTMSFLADREKPLTIYTPGQTISKVREVVEWFSNVQFDIDVHEVLPGNRIIERSEWYIDTLDNSTKGSYGLKIKDEPRGKFNRQKAEDLGVPVGPKFNKLTQGEPVEAKDGTTVRPEQVLEDDGKKPIEVVFSGRTSPSEVVEDAAQRCNVLIHDAHSIREFQKIPGRTSITQVAEIGSKTNPDCLFLSRLSNTINHMNNKEISQKAAEKSDLPIEIGVLSESTEITVTRNNVRVN
jgi:ribonuclease Z